MAVTAIGREDVTTVTPETSVEEVVQTMIAEGVGSVVVVEDDQPVGIITDRDVVIRVHGTGRDPSTVVASEVMSEDLATVSAGDGIYDLIRTMAEAGVRRVPIVHEGDLAGIVTLDDVLILLGMELNAIANLIRSESPPFEVSPSEVYDG